MRSRRARPGCRKRSRPVRWWLSHGTPSRACHNAAKTLPQILGFEPQAATHGRRKTSSHECIRRTAGCFAAQIKGLCPENPSYSASFRFIRPDGQEVWLEETGKAEFDATGRYLRLKGLTRDITERKRAEERQRMLVRELDHRVKNVLASVATVAQRTREGSGSMDEFLADCSTAAFNRWRMLTHCSAAATGRV